jgi:hypothetical protein
MAEQVDTPLEAKPVPAKPVKPYRPKEVAHDETPSQITDHAFEPRGEWYTLCKHCRLSEAAHRETTLTGEEHLHFPHASVEVTPIGRERFHYLGDDDDEDD